MIMTDASVHNQKNASDSIWYVLATVAGELASEQDLVGIAQQNRHYWNGLMAPRAATYGGMAEGQLGYDLDLPQLTDEDNRIIRRALNTRGFGGVPIPHVNNPIDFSNTVFPQLTTFLGFVFVGEVRFDNVMFLNGPLIFKDATFAGNVVNFDGATFCTETIFFSTKFTGSSSFKKTRFLKDVYFSHAKFLGKTNFVSTKFAGNVNFFSAKFEHDAGFVKTVFAHKANFQSAEFKGPTRFQEACFETRVPSFFETTLHEYTDWHDAKWPSVPDDTNEAREQVQCYQRLALMMNKIEKPDNRHLFFRKEMRARRRADRRSIASVMNWLYEFICDYGHGLTRIFGFWLGHVAVGAIWMWVARVFKSSQNKTLDLEAYEIIYDFLQAFEISFSNAHVFLGLDRVFLKDAVEDWANVPLFNFIGSLQTILGIVFLFFLSLTIRNRFRMK